MVANASNYRRPAGPSTVRNQLSRNIESLRRLIQRAVNTTFLNRGRDESFCRAVTEEAMLAVHAEIDGFHPDNEFRVWVIAIAVKIGFRSMQKPQVAETQPAQPQLRQMVDINRVGKNGTRSGLQRNRKQGSAKSRESESSTTTSNIGPPANQKLRKMHRQMVRMLLNGDHPLWVAEELEMSPEFQRIVLNEAVRKLNLLRQHLGSEGGRQASRTQIGSRFS